MTVNTELLKAIEDGWQSGWDKIAVKPRPLTLFERSAMWLAGNLAQANIRIMQWIIRRRQK